MLTPYILKALAPCHDVLILAKVHASSHASTSVLDFVRMPCASVGVFAFWRIFTSALTSACSFVKTRGIISSFLRLSDVMYDLTWGHRFCASSFAPASTDAPRTSSREHKRIRHTRMTENGSVDCHLNICPRTNAGIPVLAKEEKSCKGGEKLLAFQGV